ncbi:MAG: urate hydroxylase PuuD, partial [Pseudomonadota bacterium]|nr:urate hydroxylase PuuD [Pseudomonadota bacterium]
LPVLFCMISNHYAFTWGSANAWLILALVLPGAALIRHFFNLRHKGELAWQYPAMGGLLLLVAFALAAPATPGSLAGKAPALADVMPVIEARCQPCHAAHPRLMPTPPLGVVLEGAANIRAQRLRIVEQAGHTRAMPIGNLTGITEAERKLLLDWEAGGYR